MENIDQMIPVNSIMNFGEYFSSDLFMLDVLIFQVLLMGFFMIDKLQDRLSQDVETFSNV